MLSSLHTEMYMFYELNELSCNRYHWNCLIIQKERREKKKRKEGKKLITFYTEAARSPEITGKTALPLRTEYK